MRRGAHAIMLQGTGSHVGKTLLATALCRALREAGHDVAPFKAQNMALNAYVTRDGGEMGWAQVMQAEAAGLEPGVDMNPILLKPQSGGSQVIVAGRVWATLPAADYYRRRAELWGAVEEAYRRLAAAHELIVIEGAGSPAEPNLMDADLTNMAVARLSGAPVVLVGDIDRGGVFASLLGTLALLPRADRRRVRGFIVNRSVAIARSWPRRSGFSSGGAGARCSASCRTSPTSTCRRRTAWPWTSLARRGRRAR